MCQLCNEIESLKRLVASQQQELAEHSRLLSELSKNGFALGKTIFSVKETAAIIGLSAYTVSEMCRSGKIKCKRNGTDGRYFITADTIKEFTSKQ